MDKDDTDDVDDARADSPHDSTSEEPLGPVTPDDETAAGDTPEVHDTVSPHDLPKDHPGRISTEELAEEEGGEAATGNV